MFRKLILVAIILLSVDGIMAVGRTQEGANEEAKTKITFYTWWSGAEQDFGKALVRDFEALHPNIDIDDNYVPFSEYVSKLNVMTAANSMPDVFSLPEYITNSWVRKVPWPILGHFICRQA